MRLEILGKVYHKVFGLSKWIVKWLELTGRFPPPY